jgi:hypothetical protein
LWHKADTDKLNKEIEDTLATQVWESQDINANWNFLKNALTKAQDKFIS